MDRSEIERLIDAHGIEVVRVTFNDNANVARARNIPARFFRESVLDQGVQYPSAMMSVDAAGNFVLAAGAGFAGGYASWLLRVDPSTFAVVPWLPKTARVIADLCTLDGTPVPVAPRTVLGRVLAELEQEGLRAYGAAEHEFYVFRRFDAQGYEPSWQGVQCYSEVKQAEVDALLHDFTMNLAGVGIHAEAANTEYGPGQFEISIQPRWGIAQADASFTFKATIKETAAHHGLLATFMTKPLNGRSGSGCHFHHSLYAGDTGKNALFDAADARGLSTIAKHFLAGQLHHSAALCALANPTVNSYRRLRPYTFAPSNVTWGLENRMCMVRVPNARGEGTHFENRLPGGDCNPYLMMAAVYAAGLDGLRRRLPLPAAVEGQDAYALTDAPALPKGLGEALDALRADEALTALLGAEFVRSYTALKAHELARFEDHVTDWEVQEYRELF